jgi:hypothetical protein
LLQLHEIELIIFNNKPSLKENSSIENDEVPVEVEVAEG